MDFFNFKEERRNKKMNQKIVLVMFFIAAVQSAVSSYTKDTKVADIQIDDTPQIILLANNA